MPSRQGVFPTQGSNPGLLHCRRILYHLSRQGIVESWGSEVSPLNGRFSDPQAGFGAWIPYLTSSSIQPLIMGMGE